MPAPPCSEGMGVNLQLVSPRDNAILEDADSIFIRGVLVAGVGHYMVRVIARDPSTSEELVSVLADMSGGDRSATDESRGEQQAEVSLELPGSVRGAVLSLCANGVERPCFTLSTSTVFKVQRGGAYLFLDNDTNRSVDQYTGRLLLDEVGLSRWRAYAEALRSMDESSGATVRLMICPAKEELFQDVYPHKRAARTPIDQVSEVCAGPQWVCLLDALRSERELTYSTVDTHWSDYGAKVGAIEYLRSVGLSHVTGNLPQDFYARGVYGDLGGKVDGGQSGIFMTLAKGYRFSVPRFDNGIGNHGRVWVYMNEDADIEQTLVLFGDSFAVSMSAILASVFSRVVYCYTAAGIDPEIVRVERPAYVLAQTNQRFVVNAPSAEASVFRQVAQKVSSLDEAARLAMLERLGESSTEPYYAARMRELLS